MFHSILGPVFVLSVCIFVHELGHLLACLISGVRVEKFSLGFGKKLWGMTYKGCEYQLALIPFGGYVKMAGGDLPHESKGEKDEFHSKPIPVKVFVVLSGILMNLLLGIFLFWVVFIAGVSYNPSVIGEVEKASPADIAGIKSKDRILKIGKEDVSEWKEVVQRIMMNPGKPLDFMLLRGSETIAKKVLVENVEGIGYIGASCLVQPRIGEFVSGLPAEKAGLKKGDLVLFVDTKKVDSWEEMTSAVREKLDEFSLLVERDGKEIAFHLKPIITTEGTATFGRIGVFPQMPIKKYSPITALPKAVSETKEMLMLNIIGIWKLITGKLSLKMTAGPIGIIQMSAAAAKTSFTTLLQLTAIISICLVVINLLPIPIADGGIVFLFLLEAIRRKPFSEKFYSRFSQVGMAFLILIFVMVTINDLTRIFGNFPFRK
ncbi:RIP metalloprotease RseP [bacterium]|nr:RIP metalloprotease RseP [bacterium]